ncbi:hypothetical protein GCM10018966_061640 [Streptomyces yanii]
MSLEAAGCRGELWLSRYLRPLDVAEESEQAAPARDALARQVERLGASPIAGPPARERHRRSGHPAHRRAPSSSGCTKPLILDTDDWSVVRDQPDRRAVRPTDMLALTPTGHGFLWAGQNSARNVLLTSSGNGTGTTTVKGRLASYTRSSRPVSISAH